MIELILYIFAYVFVAGFVFRAAAPRIAWDISDRYNQPCPDRTDIKDGKMYGAIMGIFWPLTFLWFAANKCYNLVLDPKEDVFKVRPAPITGPVEAIKNSRIAKAEAREKAAKEEVTALRRKINQQERESGLVPTVWYDN